MTTLRIVAVLLVANTAVFIIGARGGGDGAGVHRPLWLPPRWVRAGIPLIIASGLWFGQSWAWWAAVAICAGGLAWIGLASPVLAVGGFFTEPSAALRVLQFGLLAATWSAALALLLFFVGD